MNKELLCVCVCIVFPTYTKGIKWPRRGVPFKVSNSTTPFEITAKEIYTFFLKNVAFVGLLKYEFYLFLFYLFSDENPV